MQVRGVAARSQALHDHVAWIGVTRSEESSAWTIRPLATAVKGLPLEPPMRYEVPAVGKAIEVAGGVDARDAVGLGDLPRLAGRERQLDHQIARLHFADRVRLFAPDQLAALEPRHATATIDRVDLIGHRIAKVALLPVQLSPPLPDQAMNLVGAGARMPVDGAAFVVAVAPLTPSGVEVSAMVGCARKPAAPPSLGVFVADGRRPGGGGRRAEDQNQSHGDETRHGLLLAKLQPTCRVPNQGGVASARSRGGSQRGPHSCKRERHEEGARQEARLDG